MLSNCVKLLGKVQKLLIKCISYSVISKRIRVVSPKFYTARKNFTGLPVPTVPTNFKSELFTSFFRLMIFTGCDIWGLWIFWQQATTCGVWLADWPGERAGNGGVPAYNHHLVIIWSYWSANKYQWHHYLFMYPKIGKT